jgi:hypothetical protein
MMTKQVATIAEKKNATKVAKKSNLTGFQLG